MFAKRLLGVAGAGRLKSATTAQERRECETIYPDNPNEESLKECSYYSSDYRTLAGVAIRLYRAL